MVNALNGGLKMLVTNAVFLGPQQAHCPVVASGVLIENPDDRSACTKFSGACEAVREAGFGKGEAELQSGCRKDLSKL